MIAPPVEPSFWPQFILQTWHDTLLIVGPLITAAWAIRSNRQHKDTGKKVAELTNGGLRKAVLEAIREYETSKAE